jgi:hypothetical protein
VLGESTSFHREIKQMDIAEQFAWIMLVILGTAIAFYSLGFNEGKKAGFWKGRSVGIKVGTDRRSING